ncbi:MAG: pilus assembly protein, partial [Stenotrophobium sp.]
AQGSNTSASSLVVAGEAADNAAACKSSTSNISSRTATSATVSWSSVPSWSDGQTYSSPSLKSIVQEIVNRAGWTPFNSMSFLITGSGRRTAYSLDQSASKAPILHIVVQGGLSQLTVRQYFTQLVNGMSPVGWTPTMGTMYEAARYFRGEAAYYGRTRGGGYQVDSSDDLSQAADMQISSGLTFSDTPTHYYPSGCTDANLSSSNCKSEAWTGTATYKSPMNDGCQSNNIVLLSDGAPNQTFQSDGPPNNLSAKQNIQSMIGHSCAAVTFRAGQSSSGWNCGGDNALCWQCGNDIAQYLDTQDQSAAFGGSQVVRTYTIGFGPGVASGATGSDAAGGEFLSEMAKAGGGQYYPANSSSELISAFKTIIGNILDINTTFVAPAVTVNTFNRLTHRNELYFAVFKPASDVAWLGNLKRYQLFQTASDSGPQIYDSTAAPAGPLLAVDPATGFFKEGTQSFWSPAPDGNSVAKGGAASVLTNTRNIYTFTGATPSNSDLTTTANAVNESNTAITSAMLGLPATATAADRTTLLQWARGIDVLDENGDGSTTDARKTMGDPLHAEPQLITYGGTDANPDISIFMGDNQGYLHAFNATDGTEQFAFIPPELLPNLNTYFTDSGTYLTRPYGMDGPITAWINDANGNGQILSGGTPESGEFAYIYAGMRRGGRNYYALDVTNRSKPLLKFEIKGGTGAYTELGQTWSRAIHARIRVGGADKDVLIFSGGYDPSEDGGENSAVTPDSIGRGLFVADANTGALLWWAGHDAPADPVHPNISVPDMQYSIPASPRPIDMDNDGRVDRIYLADTGGQVFRVVLGKDSNGIPSLSNASVQKIAALSGATAATAQRFFQTPDIALITENTTTPFLSVSLGSGFHEHPLSQVNQDRFYVLRDPEISNDSICAAGSTTCTPLFINGAADLYDATDNLAGSATATTAAQAHADIQAKKGLYITLGAGTLTGEKVMSEATTFDNKVLFASFQPGVSSGNACSATQGLSRLYEISVTDATPTDPLSQDPNATPTALTTADRAKSLKQGGLPPNPTILFPSISSQIGSDGQNHVCTGSSCLPNQALVCVGAECFNPGLNIDTTKTFWQSNN